MSAREEWKRLYRAERIGRRYGGAWSPVAMERLRIEFDKMADSWRPILDRIYEAWIKNQGTSTHA